MSAIESSAMDSSETLASTPSVQRAPTSEGPDWTGFARFATEVNRFKPVSGSFEPLADVSTKERALSALSKAAMKATCFVKAGVVFAKYTARNPVGALDIASDTIEARIRHLGDTVVAKGQELIAKGQEVLVNAKNMLPSLPGTEMSAEEIAKATMLRSGLARVAGTAAGVYLAYNLPGWIQAGTEALSQVDLDQLSSAVDTVLSSASLDSRVKGYADQQAVADADQEQVVPVVEAAEELNKENIAGAIVVGENAIGVDVEGEPDGIEVLTYQSTYDIRSAAIDYQSGRGGDAADPGYTKDIMVYREGSGEYPWGVICLVGNDGRMFIDHGNGNAGRMLTDYIRDRFAQVNSINLGESRLVSPQLPEGYEWRVWKNHDGEDPRPEAAKIWIGEKTGAWCLKANDQDPSGRTITMGEIDATVAVVEVATNTPIYEVRIRAGYMPKHGEDVEIVRKIRPQP